METIEHNFATPAALTERQPPASARAIATKLWLARTINQVVRPDDFRYGRRILVQFSDDSAQMFAKEICIVGQPLICQSTAAYRRSL